MKKIKWVVLALALILIAVLIMNKSYQAMNEANEALKSSDQVTVLEDKHIHFIPQDTSEIGLIFYPGGRVEHEAYAPLMRQLAENGYNSFIVSMPFDLAILASNQAEEIIDEYDHIKDWYIIGHSLGGVAAAQYAHENPGKLTGLVLLSAYPQKKHNLSEQGLKVLSITGSEDGLVKQDTFIKSQKQLPRDAVLMLLDGGNHDQMGYYGDQKGDKKARISREQQQDFLLENIIELIEK